VAGSSGHSKPLGFIKCWEIPMYLSDCWLLKKGSSPWSFLVHSLVSSEECTASIL
jgi:hypothetical protein